MPTDIFPHLLSILQLQLQLGCAPAAVLSRVEPTKLSDGINVRVSAAKIKTGHVLNKIVFVSAVAPVTQYLLMFDIEFNDFSQCRSIIFISLPHF